MPGVSRLGDRAKGTTPHAHNCPGCPHPVVGPSITASANVFVDGVPAMRLGDVGVHAACCAANTWIVIQSSGGLFINGSPAVRRGDKTSHCGVSTGEMIDASGTVCDNSPLGGALSVFLTGPDVVAIPPGAVPIRDELGNPMGYATVPPTSQDLGQLFDAHGRQVGTVTRGELGLPSRGGAEADDSLGNPVELALLPIGGLGKGAVSLARLALKDALKRGATKVAEATPRSLEDAYARAYNKAIEYGNRTRPADGRPGLPAGAPAEAHTKGATALSLAKALGSELLKKHHGG